MVSAPIPLLAFVGDQHPRFEQQALRLTTTATKLGNISPSNILIGWVGEAPTTIVQLRKVGFNLTSVPATKFEARYCNKISLIQKILDGAWLTSRSHLLLLDCDIAFAARYDTNVLHCDEISGRIVGHPNPPMGVWKRLFDASGMVTAGLVPTTFRQGALTPSEHLNSGVVSFPVSVLSKVASRWHDWSQWCTSHKELFGNSEYFLDQVSLALTLMEQHLHPHQLPLEYNLSPGAPLPLLQQIQHPVLLHYRNRVENGMLMETGAPSVDDAIKRINAVHQSVIRS